MGLPPSLVHATHFTDMEVEDVVSTAKVVGAEGANVCVMVDKYTMGNLNPIVTVSLWHACTSVFNFCSLFLVKKKVTQLHLGGFLHVREGLRRSNQRILPA